MVKFCEHISPIFSCPVTYIYIYISAQTPQFHNYINSQLSEGRVTHLNTSFVTRGDYKVVEMIGQKSSIAINLLNLVGHPYIALER